MQQLPRVHLVGAAMEGDSRTVALDGGFFQRAVHALDLAIRPGMVGLGQPVLDLVVGAGAIEGMAAPHGGRTCPVLR